MIPALLRLLAAGCGIALVVYWLRRQQQRPGHGQASTPERDQAPEQISADANEQTRELWQSLQEFYQQQDRELELAKYWSEDEVALAIEAYVFKLQHSSDDGNDLFRKLQQQPATTARIVLQVVADPDLQIRLRKERRGEPAIYRACQLLMEHPTEHAIPYVQRLLAADNEDVQRAARDWLARLDNQNGNGNDQQDTTTDS